MDPSCLLPHAFTVHDAGSAGVSAYRLRRMLARGQLTRVRRGLYVRTDLPPPDQRQQAHLHALRAELAVRGPGFAASHLSAAVVFGLPSPLGDLTTVHVTAVEGYQRSRRAHGVWVHHCDSGPTPTEVVDGIRVTTPARTLADCLRLFPPATSVPIADAAVRDRYVRLPDVLEVLAAQERWRGHELAVATLALVDGRRESWLESFAYARFACWGIPLPQPQVVVLDHRGRFVARCDGGWLEEATVLELDGRGKYLAPIHGVVDPLAALTHEKARSDRLGNLGLERVRLGTADLVRGPSGVVDVIEQRRAAGSRARFTGSFRLTPATGLTLGAHPSAPDSR